MPFSKHYSRPMQDISAVMTAVCLTVRSPAAGGPWAGSQPYLGQVGALSTEQELEVEVTCRREKLEETLAAVKAVHPYEEPVINVIPLYQVGI